MPLDWDARPVGPQADGRRLAVMAVRRFKGSRWMGFRRPAVAVRVARQHYVRARSTRRRLGYEPPEHAGGLEAVDQWERCYRAAKKPKARFAAADSIIGTKEPRRKLRAERRRCDCTGERDRRSVVAFEIAGPVMISWRGESVERQARHKLFMEMEGDRGNSRWWYR